MEQETVQAFIARYGLKFKAVWIAERPDRSNDWDRTATHWRVTFRKASKSLTTIFSMGSGHNGREPRADEVLDALSQDASYVLGDGASFQAFCLELGYDEDSRKAERIHKACLRTAQALTRLLGDEGRDCLLYETERL